MLPDKIKSMIEIKVAKEYGLNMWRRGGGGEREDVQICSTDTDMNSDYERG